MKMPLISKNESCYPNEPICPICKKNKVFEPHTFVAINGGALRIGKSGNSISHKNMYGYLHLTWHGHHYQDINDEVKDTFFNLEIVNDSKQGEYELYFCSTRCLREFFNRIVDLFEEKISETVKESLNWPSKNT